MQPFTSTLITWSMMEEQRGAHVGRWNMQEWLQKQGRNEEEIQAVVNGFKRALGREDVSFLSFADFAVHYQWLLKTLQVISHPCCCSTAIIEALCAYRRRSFLILLLCRSWPSLMRRFSSPRGIQDKGPLTPSLLDPLQAGHLCTQMELMPRRRTSKA